MASIEFSVCYFGGWGMGINPVSVRVLQTEPIGCMHACILICVGVYVIKELAHVIVSLVSLKFAGQAYDLEILVRVDVSVLSLKAEFEFVSRIPSFLQDLSLLSPLTG